MTSFLGGFIVFATKWAVDVSYPGAKTIKIQQFAPQIGNLTLSATIVTENEVVLNLTFSGRAYVSYPGYNWTIWVSKNFSGRLHEPPLPEGLELVDGALKVNDTCPLPNNFLSLQAKLQAIADGEWVVYGLFSATAGSNPPNPAPGQDYGFYCGLSTSGIKITVSNGNVVQLEKAPYPSNPATEQPTNSSTEQPTNPPISP